MKVLFLDDCPNRQGVFRKSVPHARIVATAAEVIDELQQNPPDVLFLDHDLGGEVFVDSSRVDCGMEVVRWIEVNKPKIVHVIVHTMNPAAGDQMMQVLKEGGFRVHRAPFGTPAFFSIVRHL